jgi:hypothetical protein
LQLKDPRRRAARAAALLVSRPGRRGWRGAQRAARDARRGAEAGEGARPAGLGVKLDDFTVREVVPGGAAENAGMQASPRSRGAAVAGPARRHGRAGGAMGGRFLDPHGASHLCEGLAALQLKGCKGTVARDNYLYY